MKSELHDFLSDLLPVMVVYNCPLSQSLTWRSITEESKRLGVTFDLMIYDNSPVAQVPPETSLTLHYHHDQTNSGVSKAYNEAFQLAQRLRKKWLLLLDQDSSFLPKWIEFYALAAQGDDQNAIAPIVLSGEKIISPFNYWLCLGSSSKTMTIGIKSLKNKYAINSGLLISGQLFEKAGGYDERIPMDFSDFAFMHRLKKLKTQLNVIDLRVSHQLSSMHNQESSKAQERFTLYCIGTKQLIGYTHLAVVHFMVALVRALKMGIHYRTLGFIKIFLRSWVTD